MDGMINDVIDLSHWNGDVDFQKVKDAGVVAVMLKATQGAQGVDPKFAANLAAAQAASLKVGAYHFGTDADPSAQAQHFLDTVGSSVSRLVLDFEQYAPEGVNHSMGVDQAHDFISFVFGATQRFPMVYSDPVHEKLIGKNSYIVENCELWLARYAQTPTLPPNSGWTTWKLWQYTDGVNGPVPHTVDGVVGHCDREYFNGSLSDLNAWW